MENGIRVRVIFIADPTIAIKSSFIAGGRNRIKTTDGVKTIATRECRKADGSNAVGDGDGGYVAAIVEGVIIN